MGRRKWHVELQPDTPELIAWADEIAAQLPPFTAEEAAAVGRALAQVETGDVPRRTGGPSSAVVVVPDA